MPVHAQGVGAFAQVESGSGESGRLGNGRVFLQIVELGRQGVHGVTERLKFAVSARLLSGGRSLHLAQQPAPPAKPDAQAPAAQATAPAPAATAPAPAATEEKTESPVPAPVENWLTGSVDFGYRWVTDAGNFQAYRSVVNLGQGPKLTGMDFTILDPKKRLFDRLDARAYGWGGDPYSLAHVNARKQGIYDFSFDYRNIAYFDAMPSYSNPLAPAGFNEQAFDTHRRNTSLSLDLRPGKQIIPYLAFDRNSGYGHGIDTWVRSEEHTSELQSLRH